MTSAADPNARPSPDPQLTQIARYVAGYRVESAEALDTARLCLTDALACAMLALRFPACTRHLGPVVPGTVVPNGVRVPGTDFELDPVKAAFDIGSLVRWLDFNDTWLAAEWGHPSDNLGAILAVADFVSRRNAAVGKPPLTMRDVLTAMIKAHEIQGVLALDNAFNLAGLDHVVLVKVASVAIATHLLGGDESQVVDALSHAWADGHSLRVYRHAPNTVSRKSWAAGDATSRAVRLAMMVLEGEAGIPSVLSARTWGFCDAMFHGNALKVPRDYGSYVMENVLFKVSFPAEFHGQTAVECALALHAQVRDRLDEIERVELETQAAAIRIISKTGPLHNAADRDHCLQYMVAVALVFGHLSADSYEGDCARDPRIDALRAKMTVVEDPRLTADYHAPDTRSVGNSVRVVFKTGFATERVTVDFPIGHRRRRREGRPLLLAKARSALETRFGPARASTILDVLRDDVRLDHLPVHEFMAMMSAV
jgi:2-methylcitrate dehydratase